jgi:hypothetical protein
VGDRCFSCSLQRVRLPTPPPGDLSPPTNHHPSRLPRPPLLSPELLFSSTFACAAHLLRGCHHSSNHTRSSLRSRVPTPKVVVPPPRWPRRRRSRRSCSRTPSGTSCPPSPSASPAHPHGVSTPPTTPHCSLLPLPAVALSSNFNAPLFDSILISGKLRCFCC